MILKHMLLKNQPGSEEKVPIYGYRERIFTANSGALGYMNACMEFQFGTTIGRVFSDLGVRAHYGHPDFIFSPYAITNGSISHAAPVINLSEDYFTGLIARLNGCDSRFEDLFEAEKGREEEFLGSMGLQSKFASGCVGILRSREVMAINFKSFSNGGHLFRTGMFFSGPSYYLNNLFTSASLTSYLIVELLFALGSISAKDVGYSESVLAAEWILSLGFFLIVPMFIESIVEKGMGAGVLSFVQNLFGGSPFLGMYQVFVLPHKHMLIYLKLYFDF